MEPARPRTAQAGSGAGAQVGEGLGVMAAIFSSSPGGINTAVTRYAMSAMDPIALAGLRFGIGFLLLLPLGLAMKCRWPSGKDWPAVAALGILFFAVFMALFNLTLAYTSAARGALALSTLPLVAMLVAAALRAEPLTGRKSLGVTIAISGVAIALMTGLGNAPPSAWRGDGIMVAATVCFAFYNVWSRPYIARSSPLGFVTAGMGAGSSAQCLFALAFGGLAHATALGAGQWIAIGYLGAAGGALTFFLWVFGLSRTTPTKVTNTITLNPVSASIAALFLMSEPVGFHLLTGIAAVFTGILIASAPGGKRR